MFEFLIHVTSGFWPFVYGIGIIGLGGALLAVIAGAATPLWGDRYTLKISGEDAEDLASKVGLTKDKLTKIVAKAKLR